MSITLYAAVPEEAWLDMVRQVFSGTVSNLVWSTDRTKALTFAVTACSRSLGYNLTGHTSLKHLRDTSLAKPVDMLVHYVVHTIELDSARFVEAVAEGHWEANGPDRWLMKLPYTLTKPLDSLLGVKCATPLLTPYMFNLEVQPVPPTAPATMDQAVTLYLAIPFCGPSTAEQTVQGFVSRFNTKDFDQRFLAKNLDKKVFSSLPENSFPLFSSPKLAGMVTFILTNNGVQDFVESVMSFQILAIRYPAEKLSKIALVRFPPASHFRCVLEQVRVYISCL
jgi:hypothetical protein